MKHICTAVWAVAYFFATSPATQADTYTEIGDAGNTIAGAQYITAPGTTVIQGTVNNAGDEDFFGFNWAVAGDFTAETNIPNVWHQNISLYAPDGTWLFGSNALVGLIVGNLAAGDYYLYHWGGEDRPFTINLNNGVDPIATPVPPALPLFVAGLGVMAWMARRRKRQAAAEA